MNEWELKEHKMYEYIRDNTEASDLKMSTDKYSKYDCSNDRMVIELKYRTSKYGPSNYNSTVIERAKYSGLANTYNVTRKIPIYAVQAESKIYLFNLLQLARDKYDFQWGLQGNFNTTTHFANTTKRDKEVGYIEWDKAIKVIELDEEEITKEARDTERYSSGSFSYESLEDSL